MHQTTIRFGDDLWGHLAVAAASSGLTVAQYVHEAAVARLAADHLRPRGRGPAEARGDGPDRDEAPVPWPVGLGRQDEHSAVRAQARQARLRATALRQEAARLRDGHPATLDGGRRDDGAATTDPAEARPASAAAPGASADPGRPPVLAELEATTDELQATNGELVATSSALRDADALQHQQARALDGAQTLLESVLHSLGTGVAVVDHYGRITMWNARSEELWGLRPDEVAGRSLLALDVRSSADPLADALRRAVGAGGEGSDVTLEAVDRRGRTFCCELLVLPLRSAPDAVHGALVLMTERRAASASAEAAEQAG